MFVPVQTEQTRNIYYMANTFQVWLKELQPNFIEPKAPSTPIIFVAFTCPVHTKTMRKRKLLKTLYRVEKFENATVSISCGRVDFTENDWSCDLSLGPFSFEKSWMEDIDRERIVVFSGILLLLSLWIA